MCFTKEDFQKIFQVYFPKSKFLKLYFQSKSEKSVFQKVSGPHLSAGEELKLGKNLFTVELVTRLLHLLSFHELVL